MDKKPQSATSRRTDESGSTDRLATFRRLVSPAKGLIFDFDGFLADSEAYHYLSYREVFARYGHEIDEREYYKYWTSLGHGARGEIERHSLDLDPVAIKEEKNPIFSRYCRDGSIVLYPEMTEALDILSRGDKKLAIASGSSSSDIQSVLANAGVTDLFPIILGSDDVPQLKPAPDIFLKALGRLGLGPSECVVFEDAEKGMQASVEAGIPVVIVKNEQTSNFDFGRADLVLDSHAELLDFTREIP